MGGRVYELRWKGQLVRVDREEVERLAREVAAGPEFGLADQLRASIPDPTLVSPAPAQAFDADIVIPPEEPGREAQPSSTAEPVMPVR